MRHYRLLRVQYVAVKKPDLGLFVLGAQVLKLKIWGYDCVYASVRRTKVSRVLIAKKSDEE